MPIIIPKRTKKLFHSLFSGRTNYIECDRMIGYDAYLLRFLSFNRGVNNSLDKCTSSCVYANIILSGPFLALVGEEEIRKRIHLQSKRSLLDARKELTKILLKRRF